MSIRAKIFIALLITALIPLVILGIFAHSHSFEGLRKQVLGEVQTFATVQAQRIADLVGHERAQLALVTSRTQLRLTLKSHLASPAESNVEKMERILTDAKASLQSFETISITGPDGVIIASTDPGLLGASHAENPVYQSALAGAFAHAYDVNGSGRETKVLLMGPLVLDGKNIGVAIVALDATRIGLTMDEPCASGIESATYLVEITPGQTLNVIAPPSKAGSALGILTLEDGKPLLPTDAPELIDAVTVDGVAVVVAVQPIPGSPLAVIVAAPKDAALDSVNQMRYTSMIILACSFGFSALVAFGLAQSISNPIKALARTAQRVAKGGSYEEADESGTGEIGVLARNFNRMTEQLLLSNRQMEKTIEKRTSELKSAQMLLIQAEKLDSLGQLAAGVAHEVKNPLAIIQMGVDFLKQNCDPDEADAVKVIGDMETAVSRADAIIHGMLDFTREREIERVLTDANQLVRESLDLVGYELRKRKVKVDLQLGENLPPVRVDRTKMEQVLINLLTNSAHAMEENGGTITVTTGHFILENAERKLGLRHFDRLRSKDGVVVFEIRDTGPGIPEDKLQKIFEPFYTTKATGQGTGLGLGISKTIIDLHHGDLQIDNHPDGGARARILLKVSDGGSTTFRKRVPKSEPATSIGNE